MYTTELLTDMTKPLRVTLMIENEEKTFRFQVLNLVRQEKIENISEFIHQRNTTRPRESIRIMEILLKQNIRNEFLSIKNKFYHRKQRLIDLGKCSSFNINR